MSERHRRVWWTELVTRETDRARERYARICGWSVDEMPMDYATCLVGGVAGPGGVTGIMDMTRIEGLEMVPPHWMSYLAVDDVDQAVEQTRQMSAASRSTWRDGAIATVADVTGAVVRLVTSSLAGPAAD